jgi:hypothetical protein
MTLALVGIAVIIAIVASTFVYYDGTIASSVTTSGQLRSIPTPTGYLGASFAGPAGIFSLTSSAGNPSTSPNLNIPQSSAIGAFSFAFSSPKYSQSDLSVTYMSCSTTIVSTQGSSTIATSTGNASVPGTISKGSGSGSLGGTNQICGSSTMLSFTYAQNTQGQYVATTGSVTSPCGNLQSIDGSMVPSQYLLLKFGVNTFGQPSATPYYYMYLVYGNCTSEVTSQSTSQSIPGPITKVASSS